MHLIDRKRIVLQIQAWVSLISRKVDFAHSNPFCCVHSKEFVEICTRAVLFPVLSSLHILAANRGPHYVLNVSKHLKFLIREFQEHSRCSQSGCG